MILKKDNVSADKDDECIGCQYGGAQGGCSSHEGCIYADDKDINLL